MKNDDHTKEITLLLHALKADNADVNTEVIQQLYFELKKMAGYLLKSESATHTYQATDLVNEAYLRLSESQSFNWRDRNHFFSAAVLSMRRVLVDHARKKAAARRIPKKMLDDIDEMTSLGDDAHMNHIIQVDDALTALTDLDEFQSKIVELRFFTGFSESEIAQILDVSRSTVQREWRIAKMWLQNHMANQSYG